MNRPIFSSLFSYSPPVMHVVYVWRQVGTFDGTPYTILHHLSGDRVLYTHRLMLPFA